MPMEERGLGSRPTQEASKGRKLGNLQIPESVQKLRMVLHAKAKEEPGFRFYLLYDKMYRQDVLTHAYRCCKANKGAAGVDGVRFEDIEAHGAERWLGELAERLAKKDCRPEAVKRVWIPKPNGKLRPLGIPTITDRGACKRLRCSCWMRPICNRSNTPTGRTGGHGARSSGPSAVEHRSPEHC